MTVNFYNISDDPRTVGKTLGNVVHTAECVVTESCTLLTPALLLAYNSSVLLCNYLQIPEWNRYYFFKNPSVQPGGKMVIHGEIDALQSFADGIKNTECIVARQENKRNWALADPKEPFEIGFKDYIYPFPLSITGTATTRNAKYVLELMGG